MIKVVSSDDCNTQENNNSISSNNQNNSNSSNFLKSSTYDQEEVIKKCYNYINDCNIEGMMTTCDVNTNNLLNASYDLLQILLNPNGKNSSFKSSSARYYLVPITESNVPAFLAVGSDYATGGVLGMYYDGKVSQQTWPGYGNIEAVPKEAKVLNYDGHMGYMWDKVYRFEAGHFIQIFDGLHGAPTVNTPPNDPLRKYKINGNEVAEDTYKQEFNKVFDSNTSLKLKNLKELTYSAMLQELC